TGDGLRRLARARPLNAFVVPADRRAGDEHDRELVLFALRGAHDVVLRDLVTGDIELRERDALRAEELLDATEETMIAILLEVDDDRRRARALLLRVRLRGGPQLVELRASGAAASAPRLPADRLPQDRV